MNQPFALRRRLARVFSECASQRAIDGLLLGLEDMRFEVRFQCGGSLGAVMAKTLLSELTRIVCSMRFGARLPLAGRCGKARRLLDHIDQREQTSFVDEFLQDRGGQSLAHVLLMKPFRMRGQSQEPILEELLRSNDSIMLNLEELQKRARPGSNLPTAPLLGNPSFAHCTEVDLLTPRDLMHFTDHENNNHSASRNPRDQ